MNSLVLGTAIATGAAVTPGTINPETGRPFYPTATNGVFYPDGTPAIISRAGLDAIGEGLAALGLIEAWDGTLEGIPIDLEGNQLPNSPEHTIHLGLAYTFEVPALAGSLTARWDYYWQDDSYGWEFNTIADEIDSWDQSRGLFLPCGTALGWIRTGSRFSGALCSFWLYENIDRLLEVG
ncbi:MAG TPA: hypothetical protein VIS55_10780 [Pseudomonadales bacterium]|jgi:hypothetical protein